MTSRPVSVMMPKQPMIDLVDQRNSGQQAPRAVNTTLLGGPVTSSNRRSKKPLADGDNRPLSVLLQPGAQMMQQQQQKASPPSSVVSSPRGGTRERSQSTGSNPSAPTSAPSPKTKPVAPASNGPVHVAPQSMDEAMIQFDQAKKRAQSRVRHNMNSTTRLVNGMGDITVCLLTRAMSEGIDHTLELRVYKKPIPMAGGGYAVGEYRNGRIDKDKKKKVKDAAKEESAETEFTIITAEELLPGEAGKDRDNVENWKRFFDVVKSWPMWWRYCMAVHKRIGWGAKIERSMLNVVDSRVLGFVTITFSRYI